VKENRVRFTGDVMWARYSDESGEREAIWMWDVPAGISVGAALTMVPQDQAQADIRRKAVDPMTMENFQEVANVLGSLLNQGGGHSVMLREVGYDDPKKGKMGAKAKELGEPVSYVVEIDGYGSGSTALRCSS
jgi:hypothetical protein